MTPEDRSALDDVMNMMGANVAQYEEREAHAEAAVEDLSEDALASDFTYRYRDSLLYVEEWRRWLVWDSTRWCRDRTVSVFDRARRLCREKAELVEISGDGKPNASTVRARSAKTTAAVVRFAAADPTHARVTEQFDANPMILNTPGGTVNLLNGRLRPHRQADMITKCTSVRPGGDCPLWRRSLTRWTAGDDELISFIQRLLGYSLTGVTTEEVFAFFYGSGGNGKGSLLNTFTSVLGDYDRRTDGDIHRIQKRPTPDRPRDAPWRPVRCRTGTDQTLG